ncbi:MAG: precorrin-6y C5,15-methyltransferase (decarboxylating) subunit CbiE [Lentisphaerae bacterium]|nr:precorrin-6y C5,15-methyltransferase (decarboxylating) subunit CbiE [Lentisphaerota bacterium]
MSKRANITVIGCGVSPECISTKTRKKVLESDVIAGGKRLLDFFPEFKGRKIALKSGILEIISELKRLSANKRIAILASGDPLFHGVAALVARHFNEDEFEIIPNVTAMQSLFSKLKIPWDNVKLLSIHGGRRISFRNTLSSSIAAIYCDDKITAANLAAKFVESFPACGKRSAVLAENLGMENESIQTDTLARISKMKCGSLSILVLLPSEEITDEGIVLGLPDGSYICENRMITHSEVRAVVLSKLKIGAGIMWDIGAGSGSVGIEVASLCSDMKVKSVESDGGRFNQLRKNIDEFGVSNVEALECDALKAITSLTPRPRCIFIGGGGKDVRKIAEKAFAKLLPGGRLVVTAVLLETKAALTKCLKKNFMEAVSISVSRSSKLGSSRIMKSENSVDIFVYEK